MARTTTKRPLENGIVNEPLKKPCIRLKVLCHCRCSTSSWSTGWSPRRKWFTRSSCWRLKQGDFDFL